MMSARLIPAPCTLTSTSSGPGAGTGRSATSSRPPSTTVTARIRRGYRPASAAGREPPGRGYRRRGMAGLRFLDDDGVEIALDAAESESLLAVTRRLEPATVSACPDCRSRVLAAVALVDLLDDSAPHPRAGELVDLAD